jgi:hypothetical protein
VHRPPAQCLEHEQVERAAEQVEIGSHSRRQLDRDGNLRFLGLDASRRERVEAWPALTPRRRRAHYLWSA